MVRRSLGLGHMDSHSTGSARRDTPYCAQFGLGSIITPAMQKKVHRAGGRLGLFAARRWWLHHGHRMLTALMVASSSLTMSVAVFKPAWGGGKRGAGRRKRSR